MPAWLSDRLAEARPHLVRYEFFDGAIHVGSWNQDRNRYEHAVRGSRQASNSRNQPRA